MGDHRIHVIGDELVAGYGDPRALGWVGRVMARTPRTTGPLWMSLAVPGETTLQLAERWHSEVALRSSHTGTNRLVIGLGVADVRTGVSPARTRLALANIIDKAVGEHRECFVVGPPPLPRVDPDGTAALVQAATDVCQRRKVPFVDTFEPLRHHEQWLTDVASGDGFYPRQAGYGLLAWLVLHRGWYEWLGLPEQA